MGKGGLSMPATSVQKLAKVLKVLVTITFICNLTALPLVAGLSRLRGVTELLGGIGYFSAQGEGMPVVAARMSAYFLTSWIEIWQLSEQYAQVLTLFLLFCGVCTAVTLWQARRVLNTILAGVPFQNANGISLRRAAVCCFLISAAALVRLLWGFWYYASIQPLLTYNALFVPVFFMGGLLCLVMSALFRQAAELKAENDLTI